MKKGIVCFGDSNTHGYESATDGRFSEEIRWPCLLQKKLGEEYHIYEEGLSGRTTVFEDPLHEGLNGLSTIYPCLMTHEPVNLLIIMLGTNDTKERFSVSAAGIALGLERLTAKAIAAKQAWHNKSNILIIAPAPIDKRYETTPIVQTMGKGCAEKSMELAKYYEPVAKRLGCHFLDAGKIPGIQMHPNDYMHLDKNSHTLLADAIANMIPDII